MKILWLTSQFPSNEKSIKGIYLYRTVKYLSTQYDIETWCFYPKVPPLFSIIKNPFKAFDLYKYWKNNLPKSNIKLPGIKENKLAFITYWRLPRSIFHYCEAYFIYWAAKRKIKNISKDFIIYSNWIFPSGHVAYLLSKKIKIPYTVALLGTDVHNLKYGTLYWKTAKRILENAEFITSVSQELFDKCKKEKIFIPNKKLMLIGNIYDINKFSILDKAQMRVKYNLDSNKKIIFFAGGLVQIKNVDILLYAFNKINDPNFILIIAGKGSEETNLKRLTKNFKFSENIIFVGNLMSEELIEYFNLSDVFTLPSKNEGTPNVIIEALLCGVPVVASNVGGIPNLIQDNKNGILVKPNNIDDLTEGLVRATRYNWDRKELRNSVSRFFPDEVFKSYVQLFDLINTRIN